MTDDMAPVKIELEREVRISGAVQGPDGNPVAGATVAPADGTGNSLTGDTRFSVVSAKDGTFVMTLPASGKAKYNLEAHDGGYRQWRKWANGVLPPIQTKPGDELKNVVIELTRPAVVRGHVKDESGKPLVDREVRASAADKMENRYYDPTTKTDKNGDFELRFVRPGDQFIQAAPFFWTNVPPGGMSLKLKEGETNSLSVTVKEGEAMAGVELTAPESTKFPSFEEQLRRAIEKSEHPATQPEAPGADYGNKQGAAPPASQPGFPTPAAAPAKEAAERAAQARAKELDTAPTPSRDMSERTNEDLNALPDSIEELSLRGFRGYGMDTVTDDGIRNLEHCTKLRILKAGALGLTDRALESIGKLQALEELHLDSNKITGEGLRHLLGLKHLRRLYLTSNPLRPEAFTTLPMLRELTHHEP